MSDLEAMARAICEADGVDPNMDGVGIGFLMPLGKHYKMWEARMHLAIAARQALKEWESKQ